MYDYDNHMIEAIKNYRDIEPGSRFLCMFSGGKDSGLAMSLAIASGAKPMAIIHILDGENSLYHNQQASVIEAQAKAMDIKLNYMPYKWWRDWTRACEDLEKLRESGAQSIVFGDIRLKYIFLGDIPLCEKSGYKAVLPIGGVSYSELMNQIEKHQIISIITKINHPAINRNLLGRVFTREVYEYMASIGIDPFGKFNEFHTTLVSADFFVSPLRYHLVSNIADDMISVIID